MVGKLTAALCGNTETGLAGAFGKNEHRDKINTEVT